MTDLSDIATSAEAMEADVLRHRELRADGHDHAAPMPDALRATKRVSPAEWAYRRVILYLKAFEESLDDGQEAAMGFAGGAGGVLRIEGIGFHAPDLVTFTGRDDRGNRCQLIQHVHQLNVLLRAVPRPDPAEAPRRIGFDLARALEREVDAAGDDGGDAPAPA